MDEEDCPVVEMTDQTEPQERINIASGEDVQLEEYA